jgi:uncharacterized RDD family membrane protein YckC
MEGWNSPCAILSRRSQFRNREAQPLADPHSAVYSESDASYSLHVIMVFSTIFCNRCGHPSASDAQFCQKCGLAIALAPYSRADLIPPIALPHFAGFWIRVVAAILDFVLQFAASFPIKSLLGSVITAAAMSAQLPMHNVLQATRIARISIGALLIFAYRAGMESSVYQATLGKMAMGLKITDLEGKRISVGRAVGRYFAKCLSLLSLGIGYAMAGFDKEKRALHDRIVATLVVYRR